MKVIFKLECPVCEHKETREVKPKEEPLCPVCFCNMMATEVKVDL